MEAVSTWNLHVFYFTLFKPSVGIQAEFNSNNTRILVKNHCFFPSSKRTDSLAFALPFFLSHTKKQKLLCFCNTQRKCMIVIGSPFWSFFLLLEFCWQPAWFSSNSECQLLSNSQIKFSFIFSLILVEKISSILLSTYISLQKENLDINLWKSALKEQVKADFNSIYWQALKTSKNVGILAAIPIHNLRWFPSSDAFLF